MKFFKIYLTICAALTMTVAHGRPPGTPRAARVTLASRSIRLGSAEGDSAFSIVFSTASGGARAFGNGEFRPSTSRPGFYEAAYAINNNSGGTTRRVETGTIFVEVNASDANSDTVIDLADKTAAVEATLSAQAVPKGSSSHARVSQANFSIRLAREAGSAAGSFTTDIIPEEELGGGYNVLSAEGSVVYRRTDAGALLDFSLSNATTNALAVSRIIDSNTVRIAAFRLRVSPTKKVRIGPVNLNRFGSVYRGDVNFSDGLAETAAPDFRSWIMQITDSEGAPNFSDPLPPYVAVQPRRQITNPGATVTLSVVVEGPGPFTYKWEQNGHGLSNEAVETTGRVLVIPNLSPEDLGGYRVRVSNAVGSVYSESTSVSFRAEPR